VIAIALGAWTAALAAGCGDKGDGKNRPKDGGSVSGSGGSVTADAGGSGGAGGSCPAPDGGGGAGCSIPGCGPGVALPPGNSLTDVWMGPGADAWAVGESGFVGRRAPETGAWCWCAPAPPATLRGIWGASDQALFAVGDGGRLLRFDGTQWFNYQFITNSGLNAVFGTGPNDVWAVGQNGTALHFDGTSWSSDQPAADLVPNGVLSMNDVWIDPAGTVRAAVGASISGTDPIAGYNAEALILRHGPAGTIGWTIEASFPQHGTAFFLGLSGSSATNIWAVGRNEPSGAAANHGFAVSFDGTTWTRVPQPATGILFEGHTLTDVAVATPDAGATWALSAEQGFRFDGTNWTTAPELAGAVALDARNGEMYAVGTNAVVFHWTAAAGWVVDRPPAKAPAIPLNP
jgi:hypothetical protein